MSSSEKMKIENLRKQGMRLGLIVGWLPFGFFLVIGLLWYYIFGFKANTLSFWMLCTLGIWVLYHQILMMVQIDFLYGKRILEAIFGSDWTTPIHKIPIIKDFIHFKNNEESGLKESFVSLKKHNKDIYRYIEYSTKLVQTPLYLRAHYELKQRLTHYFTLLVLIFLIIQMSTGMVSKLQEQALSLWPNLMMTKIVLISVVLALYFSLEIFLRRRWCNSSGNFGAILTFLETKSVVKHSVFSKEFIVQYLVNLCLARYGVDPKRLNYGTFYFGDDAQVPSDKGKYLVINSKGLEVHDYTSDPREPYFYSHYDNFNDYVVKLVGNQVGFGQAVEYLLLHGRIGGTTIDALQENHNSMNTSQEFIERDTRKFMKSLSYCIPRMFL